VHAFLWTHSRRDWVPGDLLEWVTELAGTTGNRRAAAVVRTVADEAARSAPPCCTEIRAPRS
jgi:hypothetical protein